MKKLLILMLALAACAPSSAQELKGKKIYECRFLENAPYGVTAWAQSAFVKDPKNRDTRFADYNAASADALILDATAVRDTAKDAAAATRETAIYSAYDEKGWYLYIEAQEPLIGDILDNAVDPQSPGQKELYEIFFTPGLENVPYYQLMQYPFSGKTNFVDWGMPHRRYRTLENSAKVESLPLEKGFGTFVFVPWEGLYERLPVNGDYWRFSVIRWMPFGKAGGVTWGGQVHETGDFGLLHFAAPTPDQKTAMQKRMLRAAWFKFLAASKKAAAFWNDEKLGDRDFYITVLKPEIDHNKALGESLGKPDEWNSATLEKAAAARDDWMEFDYKVSELRTEYLLAKQFQPTGR